MRKIIQLFVKYPILANTVIFITLIGGVLSIVSTKKAFFPEIESNSIRIQATLPGASPQELEEGVTQRIEESIVSIAGIDEVRSTSVENSTSVTVSVLNSYDIDEVFTEVKNAVDRISSFPASMERPTIYKRKPVFAAAWLGLTGDVDLLTLKRYADRVEDDLLASGLISQMEKLGYPEREISIEVSEQDLRRYNLTFDQVASAVRENNRDISAGSIKAESEELLIRSRSKESDARQIGEIVLRANADGTRLLLRDVASVQEQFADSPLKFTLNGKNSVLVRVDKLAEEDLEEIDVFVKEYVERFNEENDAVHLEVAFSFMDILQQRLDMLTGNGIVGIILVLVALGLFLSLRLSFWVAWGIPSSFLGMFMIGTFFGLTINMISLFGMIVVIGILVDDGIVIAENIFTHFQKTRNPWKAAIDGTMEVLPAVFTSVLTTVVAFLPLLLIEGTLSFLSDLAFVVVASLVFSLLEAFFVLPAHLASPHVLQVKKEDTRSYKIRKKLNDFIDFLRYKLYGNTLKLALDYKPISVAIFVGLVPITIGLFAGGFIKGTLFPNIQGTQLGVNIEMTPGTREHKVAGHLERFEKAIWEVNEEIKAEYNDTTDYINFVLRFTGGSNYGNGSNHGQVFAFYRELDGSTIDGTELVKRIRRKIGAVPEALRFSVSGDDDRFGKPVSVRLTGRNIKEMEKAGAWLKEELAELPDLKEIEDNIALGNRELQIDLTEKAYFLGLSHGDITNQVRQGFFGEEVQRLQKGKDEVRVWVRYPSSGRLNLGQLEQMKIKLADGVEYPLTELAEYDISRGVAGIRHYDGAREVTVSADLIDPEADVPAIIKTIREDIKPRLEAKFAGVSVDFGGQSQEAEKAFQQLFLYFGIAVLVIALIIIIHFRSFYQGIMVMIMIPLGWIGAMFGHLIQGIPVSVLSMWGMIALSGVIINDAVVFLAKYNSLIQEGKTVREAAYEAGTARFRAILLTSLTTVLGLFPLLAETSVQAQILIPMAVSMAYGVLIGTFIILLFFPVLIIAFNDVRVYFKWLWTGQRPEPREVERVIIDDGKQLEEKLALPDELADAHNGSRHNGNGNGAGHEEHSDSRPKEEIYYQ